MEAAWPFNVPDLIRRFDGPGVVVLVLVGSYARGDAGPWSDVDLVRFTTADAPPSEHAGSYLIDGRLVVLSDVVPPLIERWFTEPDAAVSTIAGLRTARPLLDRGGMFAQIQTRAHAFVWDAPMQQRANAWASAQLIGWIEEAHKGLEGLRRNDLGRLLNARHGLSWGLSRVMIVARGVLLAGDNDFFDAVETVLGSDSKWVRLRRIVFGVEAYGETPPTVREQVIAGLRLYCVTAALLADALQPEHAPLIQQTAARIDRELGPLPLGVR